MARWDCCKEPLSSPRSTRDMRGGSGHARWVGPGPGWAGGLHTSLEEPAFFYNVGRLIRSSTHRAGLVSPCLVSSACNQHTQSVSTSTSTARLSQPEPRRSFIKPLKDIRRVQTGVEAQGQHTRAYSEDKLTGADAKSTHWSRHRVNSLEQTQSQLTGADTESTHWSRHRVS